MNTSRLKYQQSIVFSRTYTQGRNDGEAKGAQFLGRRITAGAGQMTAEGAEKLQQYLKYFYSNTVPTVGVYPRFLTGVVEVQKTARPPAA